MEKEQILAKIEKYTMRYNCAKFTKIFCNNTNLFTDDELLHILKKKLNNEHFCDYHIIDLLKCVIDKKSTFCVRYLMNEYNIYEPLLLHRYMNIYYDDIYSPQISYLVNIGINFDIKNKNKETVFDNHLWLKKIMYMIPDWNIQRLFWIGMRDSESTLSRLCPDVIRLIIGECRDWRYFRIIKK